MIAENTNDDGYRSLREAIVEQAFRDYRYCIEEMYSGWADKKNRDLYREVLDFLESDWYRWLTDIDANSVMGKIKGIIATEKNRPRYMEKPVCIKDCFAMEGGRCGILIENDFKEDWCPFCKKNEDDIAGRRDRNR